MLRYGFVAADYFLEIEGHFAHRRGTPFILSAKDWTLMKKWADDGIPLPVVIEAIDTVFEKNESSGRRKAISSLSYCRHAVKELWEERRELQIGAAEASPEEGAVHLLESLALSVEGSSAPTSIAASFAQSVRALSSEKNTARIEERLIELEHAMIEQILAGEDASAIREEAIRALGDTSRLDEKTRARTEEANLRRLVRDRFALPRLTLFR